MWGQTINADMQFIPVFVLPALIAICLLETDMTAVYFGVFCGILLDFSSGSIIGTYAVLLCVLCPMVSLVAKKIKNISLLRAWIVGFFFIFIFCIYNWFIGYVTKDYSQQALALINFYVPKYFYTLLLVPVAYLINLGIFIGLRPPRIGERKGKKVRKI